MLLKQISGLSPAIAFCLMSQRRLGASFLDCFGARESQQMCSKTIPHIPQPLAGTWSLRSNKIIWSNLLLLPMDCAKSILTHRPAPVGVCQGRQAWPRWAGKPRWKTDGLCGPRDRRTQVHLSRTISYASPWVTLLPSPACQTELSAVKLACLAVIYLCVPVCDNKEHCVKGVKSLILHVRRKQYQQ